MTSQIDPTKPAAGNPSTADVRNNFQTAANEITALQAAVATLQQDYALVVPNEQYVAPTTGNTILVGQLNPIVIANPAGSLAALGFSLPVPVGDGHKISFIITQAISTITWTSTTGITVNASAPANSAGYTTFKLRYDANTTSWMLFS
jgi:hypothetical protein